MSAPTRTTQPDGSVRITFAAPIFDQAEPKRGCTLRPPTVGEYLDLGDPLTVVVDHAGAGVPVVDRALLLKWVERLMTDHDPVLVSRSSDLALAMMIEEVVLGFFSAARRRLRPPSPDLSAPASPPEISNA